MRILHVIDGFGAGGAETWLVSAVNYLHRTPSLGLEFHFLVTGGEKRVFDDEVVAAGSKIFYYKYSFSRILDFRIFLRKLLDKNDYAAIHDHQDFVSGWHFLAGAGSLPPVRISHLHNPLNFVHNYTVSLGRHFSFRTGRLLMAHFSTGITGTSEAVMDEYGYNKWPYQDKRIKAAYCGFDVSKFKFDTYTRDNVRRELGFVNPDLKIALFVGRIGLQSFDQAVNQKNPEFAFLLAKTIIKLDNLWRFVFVGYKGELGAEMDQEVNSSDLAGKIVFTGLRNDVDKIMTAADVLVFPSFWEGLGMVAVEAQASGLPIVMSDTIPEEAVICPEIIVRETMDEGKWIDALKRLTGKNVDRNSFNQRVQLSPFSIENSVGYLNKIYRKKGGN